MRRKLNNQSGFSLAETLLAVLILLLVSVIVANGVPAARNAYEKVVIGANAKVLLSTAVSAMRDELATAREISVGKDAANKDVITYFSADRGATSEISIDSSTSEVMLQEYIRKDPVTGAALSATAKPRYLVPKSAATDDLYVTYGTVTYTVGDEYIGISGLGVYRKSKPDSPMASTNLRIRLLIPTPA